MESFFDVDINPHSPPQRLKRAGEDVNFKRASRYSLRASIYTSQQSPRALIKISPEVSAEESDKSSTF
jgi:hypothetical protein